MNFLIYPEPHKTLRPSKSPPGPAVNTCVPKWIPTSPFYAKYSPRFWMVGCTPLAPSAPLHRPLDTGYFKTWPNSQCQRLISRDSLSFDYKSLSKASINKYLLFYLLLQIHLVHKYLLPCPATTIIVFRFLFQITEIYSLRLQCDQQIFPHILSHILRCTIYGRSRLLIAQFFTFNLASQRFLNKKFSSLYRMIQHWETRQDGMLYLELKGSYRPLCFQFPPLPPYFFHSRRYDVLFFSCTFSHPLASLPATHHPPTSSSYHPWWIGKISWFSQNTVLLKFHSNYYISVQRGNCSGKQNSSKQGWVLGCRAVGALLTEVKGRGQFEVKIITYFDIITGSWGGKLGYF